MSDMVRDLLSVRGRVPTLTACTVRFLTKDKGKDASTYLMVSVRDASYIVAARVSGAFGPFPEHRESAPLALAVHSATEKDSLLRGHVTIRIDPTRHEIWRFDLVLELQFSDGSRLAGGAEGVELTQDHRDQTFASQGILR